MRQTGTSRRGSVLRRLFTRRVLGAFWVGVTASNLVAQAKKVSSLTFGTCPGLSSTYWTNSAKKKNLVLKWE